MDECIHKPTKAPGLPEIHQAIFDEVNASTIEELILQHTQHVNLQTPVSLWGHKRHSRGHTDKGNLASATPFHLAVFKGDTKIINTLLSGGADPSLCCTFSAKNISGPEGSVARSFRIQDANALHLALFLGDTKAATKTLRGASDPKSLIEATMGGFSSVSSRHTPDTGRSTELTGAGATALHIPFFESLCPTPKRTQKDVASNQRDDSSANDKPVLELIELMLEFEPVIDVTMQKYGHVHISDGGYDCDVYSKEFRDVTPFHLSGITGYHTAAMKRMLQAGAGADPNKTFRLKSSLTHDRYGESKDKAKTSLSEHDREMTLLHYLLIAQTFLSEQAQVLLDSGADTSLKVKTLLVNELLRYKKSPYSSIGLASLETTAPEVDCEGLIEGLKIYIPPREKPEHQKKKGETGEEPGEKEKEKKVMEVEQTLEFSKEETQQL